jgi:large subunit ribosomal protein L30
VSKLNGQIFMAASSDADAPASGQTAAPAKPARPPGGADKRRLKLTQIKSTIGQSPRHRGTMRALGLTKIGKSVEQDGASPVIQGMLRKVAHLVKVEDA